MPQKRIPDWDGCDPPDAWDWSRLRRRPRGCPASSYRRKMLSCVDLTLDCSHPDVLAEFWKAAAGYVDEQPPAPFRTRAEWLARFDEDEDDGRGAAWLHDPSGAGCGADSEGIERPSRRSPKVTSTTMRYRAVVTVGLLRQPGTGARTGPELLRDPGARTIGMDHVLALSRRPSAGRVRGSVVESRTARWRASS